MTATGDNTISYEVTPPQRTIDTPLPTSTQDARLYMAIIGILGVTLVLAMLGGIVLAGLGKEIPAALIAIAAGAGGALGGALVGPAAKA
jgi:hypothetical protein